MPGLFAAFNKATYASYADFEQKKSLCRECPVGLVYDRVVCSEGCKTNPVVFVTGEAPGSDEIDQGRPFIGKAGKLLRSTLNEFGFRSINTLITNVIPCRPLDNKFPQDSEMVCSCVKKWLAEEIRILQPKFVLLLGAQPLKYLAEMSGITSKRGLWIDAGVVKLMPTFHPSYVLRKQSMEDGAQIMQDFRADVRLVAQAAGFIQ